ncbi:MAG: Obg family GTPase CgtA [Candidatus Pacebacteria bacterium]|nr:Obg family GTPase CgtA [Candidatus Paceibacterota bacterium]
MAFVDEMKFHAHAGRGGVGVVRWLHEYSKEWSGASGGNGGRGGDIRVKAVRDLGILARYRNTKEFNAEKGGDGMKNSRHGKNGDTLVIDLPIGSIVTDHRTGYTFQLLEEGETVRILKGGSGGLGNEYFKSSTNITPMQSTDGYDGEEGDFTVELELVADAGFIGLPNAGKSSLLNVLTNADAKVGNYAFTTLEPNLGALYNFVLADIPGLIEGASEGKGLGHQFLRHVRRTKILFHLISLEDLKNNGESEQAISGAAQSNEGDLRARRSEHEEFSSKKISVLPNALVPRSFNIDSLISNYKTIRAELKQYGHGLDEKAETIILTKTDMVDAAAVSLALKELSKLNKDILSVTIYDDASVKEVKDEIVKRLRK